jgi:hypothetical protein
MLQGEERGQAERVLEVCSALAGRARLEGKLVAAPEDLELRRELGRLVEFLSRRSAKAVPLATLGRLALADLVGDLRSVDQACAECEAHLTMIGL